MIERYVGDEDYARFLDATNAEQEDCGVISPGGAAMLLRVSRQRVYQIINDRADVRAWAFFEHRASQRPSELYVSIRDLVRYGKEQREMTEADFGFFGLRIEAAVADAFRAAGQLDGARRAAGFPPLSSLDDCQLDKLLEGR